MKILMVSWEYPPQVVGGLARHVQELSEALVARGHTVHVLTGPYSEEPTYSVVGGVHVHRARLGYPDPRGFFVSVLNLNFGFLEQAVALALQENFDIIHCHDWLGAYAARVLKHALNLPLIATIHATEYGRNNGLHNDLQRQISDSEWWLTYESWKVICCSKYMAQELASFFQLPPDKIQILPNGVDPQRFLVPEGEDLRLFRRRYAADHQKLVFFVGRIVREKGAQDLLAAIPKIKAYYRDVRFVLAGRGPLLDELRHLAHNLQLDDLVSFTGYVDESTLNKLYAVADIAVYPSLYEPFGIVALEAMATGTPVVVTDVGGLGEIVVHGVNGLKAYTGNSNSLADNLLTLLHKPDLARELAQEALRDVHSVYNWSKIAQQTEDVYRRVIAEVQEKATPIIQPACKLQETVVPSRYAANFSGGGLSR